MHNLVKFTVLGQTNFPVPLVKFLGLSLEFFFFFSKGKVLTLHFISVYGH